MNFPLLSHLLLHVAFPLLHTLHFPILVWSHVKVTEVEEEVCLKEELSQLLELVISSVSPYADGTGVLYGGGFQSSPLALAAPPSNPAPLSGPPDYGLSPGQNFMRAQGGCIHSCGWGRKK